MLYVLLHLFNIILKKIECGGKMHLREGEFSKAHTDFFEAFKNYDESGSRRLVMLMFSLLLKIQLFCVADALRV